MTEQLLKETVPEEETQVVLKVDFLPAASGLHSLGSQEAFSAAGPGRTIVIAAAGRAALVALSTHGPNVIVVRAPIRNTVLSVRLTTEAVHGSVVIIGKPGLPRHVARVPPPDQMSMMAMPPGSGITRHCNGITVASPNACTSQ